MKIDLKKKNMQIIVLGMHRSGTSLVTRLINMMGAYLGPSSIHMEAHKDNPKGYWERRDVMNINKKILKKINADWDRLSKIDFSKITIGQQNSINDSIKKIIQELDAHRPWVIKDPRLCITFPFWEPFLEKPLIIYIHRDPIQIAQSLQTRNNFPINFSISLWEEYIETAFNAIKDIPKIILFHRDFFQNPIKTTLNLFQDLQKRGVMGLKMLSDQEINTFIDPKLYREKGDKRLQRKYISLVQGNFLNAIEEKNENNIYQSINTFDSKKRHLQLKAFENVIFSKESTNKPYSPHIHTRKIMPLQEKDIIGHLDKITRISVDGWAAFLNNETPVEVKLFVNDKIVKSILAKKFREETKTKGIHPTGNCGFHFELEGDQVLNQNDVVSVKAGKRDIELTESPKTISNRWFFIHLPKTGGTSFKRMLFKRFQEGEIYPTARQIKQHGDYPHFKDLIEFNKEELSKIKLLCAHYPFVVGDIFAGDIEYITFLREPVKRCISFLFHSKRVSPDASYHELLKIEKKQIHNHQVRLLADQQLAIHPNYFISEKLDERALEQAKENLSKCHFIGICEEFSTSVKLFEKMFNMQLGPELRVNVTNSSIDEIDEELIEKIRQENLLDIQLYEFACEKFKLLKKKYSIGIQPSKEQLRTAENAIALDKKEYMETTKLNFYKGVLDNVKDGIIHGWAKRNGENKPVSIDIIINNKVVTTVIADQHRKDLEKKGIGRGKHGFSFDLTTYLAEEIQYMIQVKISGTQRELRKSPLEIKFKKQPGEMKIKKRALGKKREIGRNLINRNKRIIMGFSPKAGCTLANKMFFESAGCLEEALSNDPWIHKYRPIYNSQNPVTLKDMQRADFYKFKIVRNPFKRVVSSYAHAMFYKYAKDDIKSVLKTDVPNNITFLQFLDYLEKIDLLSTDPHHGLQKLVKFGEGTNYKYDYICKLESLEAGVKEINKNSMAEFKLEKNISDSYHHVTKIMSFNDTAYDKLFLEIFSIKGGSKLPDFKFFYNKEIIERVSELFKEDLDEYGYSYDLED